MGELLEDEIEREYQEIVDCYAEGNTQQARWHNQKMSELIAQRDPETVRAMERERGLG